MILSRRARRQPRRPRASGGTALHRQWHSNTSAKPILVKKETATPHPSDQWATYLQYALNDAGQPILLTGPAQEAILVWNPHQAAVGHDTWAYAHQVKHPSPVPPFSRHSLDITRLEPCLPESNLAVVDGSPANLAVANVYTPIVNWPAMIVGGTQITGNASTGEFTVSEAGIYRATVTIVFAQGNANKELSILFWLRGSVLGDEVFSVFDVATDKTTLRSGNAVVSLDLAAGEVLQTGLSWVGATIGTVVFSLSSFQLNRSLIA